MKNIYFLLVLFTATTLLGQNTPNQEYTKEYYLQKSKDQNKTAWILLSTGTVIGVVGLIGFGNSWDDSSNSSTDIYGFLFLGGVISTLGSIPLFISSGRNARKAATISFNNQPILCPTQNFCVQNPQPSLLLTINF